MSRALLSALGRLVPSRRKLRRPHLELRRERLGPLPVCAIHRYQSTSILYRVELPPDEWRTGAEKLVLFLHVALPIVAAASVRCEVTRPKAFMLNLERTWSPNFCPSTRF